MNQEKKQILRIEVNYAASQGTFWFSFCAIASFIAIYLGYRGLSNTQIGLTTSLGSGMAIVLQLILSNVLDKHPELPIKRLMTVLFLISISAAACLHFLTLPTALMILCFSTAHAMEVSNDSYLNAQLVQFNNAGIPAHYGWPRGIGSLCYSLAAYIFGRLVEAHSPDVLMPFFMVGTAVSMGFVLLMPIPQMSPEKQAARQTQHHTSYREMLTGNRMLVVYLCCTMLNSMGNMAGYTFIMRVVERLNCGMAEYGVSEFIRAAAEVPALFASGLLLARFKPKTMITASFFFYGLRLVLLAIAPSIGVVYAASALNMVCVGLSTFSAVMFVNSIVRDTEKVRGQSLSMLCGSIGAIIGSGYAGFMIDAVGLNAMLLTSTVCCMAASAGMLFLCKPRKA